MTLASNKLIELEYLGVGIVSGTDPSTGVYVFKNKSENRTRSLSEHTAKYLLDTMPNDFSVIQEIEHKEKKIEYKIPKRRKPKFRKKYPVEISFITGTLNRLKMLKAMLKSLKMALGEGIKYEIIVVDGGSTDGTREWLLKQDIISIFEPKAEGACTAYNRGFGAARGKYTVHLNDDVLFKEKGCLRKAYNYMEKASNKEVGQLAFYFKTSEEPHYHIEYVFGSPYANLGMTRRELGDEAGWWGTDYHTYGGDTELSVKIKKLGYEIEGFKLVQVKDIRPMDKLRKYHENLKVNDIHPDTKKFWKKWKNHIT